MLLFLSPYCSTKIILFGPKLGLKVITTPFGSPSSKYGTYMNPIDQQQTKPLSTLPFNSNLRNILYLQYSVGTLLFHIKCVNTSLSLNFPLSCLSSFPLLFPHFFTFSYSFIYHQIFNFTFHVPFHFHLHLHFHLQ